MHIECNVSSSQGAITTVAEVLSQLNRALEKIIMPPQAPITNPPRESLVPLRSLPCINEIDAILRSVVEAERKQVRAAIDRVLKEWPGRRRDEIWARLRQLRNEEPERGWRHTVWSEEDLNILRTYYAEGRAGVGRAVKEILVRHPDWTAQLIRSKAKKLGLPTWSKERRPWSQEEKGYLLWNAGEKPIGRIARKLGRSVNSIRFRLSSLGLSAKVRTPKDYNLHRVSKLLGVSDRAVRKWFQRSLLGETANQGSYRGRSPSGPHLTIESIVAFCVKHPDKINTDGCDPDLLQLIEDTKVRLPVWHGSSQHLIHERRCPRCGRIIRGNAYFHHQKACRVALPQSAGTGPQTTMAGQQSASSNV